MNKEKAQLLDDGKIALEEIRSAQDVPSGLCAMCPKYARAIAWLLKRGILEMSESNGSGTGIRFKGFGMDVTIPTQWYPVVRDVFMVFIVAWMVLAIAAVKNERPIPLLERGNVVAMTATSTVERLLQ